jgi:hypothetical protein
VRIGRHDASSSATRSGGSDPASDTVHGRSIGSTVDGIGSAAPHAPVVVVLGEIHQGALTSTRTLLEISEFAAVANASLMLSSGST